MYAFIQNRPKPDFYAYKIVGMRADVTGIDVKEVMSPKLYNFIFNFQGWCESLDVGWKAEKVMTFQASLHRPLPDLQPTESQ